VKCTFLPNNTAVDSIPSRRMKLYFSTKRLKMINAVPTSDMIYVVYPNIHATIK